MTLCNPYAWPWVGDMLRERRKKEGRYLAYRLMARHEAYEVMRYANNNLKMAAVTRNQRDLYTYIGMTTAARERIEEENRDVS